MNCDWDVVLLMCSLGQSGTGKVFGSTHREKSGKCKVRKKRTFQSHTRRACTFTVYMQCIAPMSWKWGLTCLQPLTLVSFSPIFPLSCISASSSPSVSLVSLLLYSPPPTYSLLPSPITDSAFSSRLASFLLWKAWQDSDILIISVHIPHLISPSCFLQNPLLPPCLILPLLLPLSACWRLECEFPLFKVLGWAVSWEIPEQEILVKSE